MTTPEFIQWLDTKMAAHGEGKLTPPPEVLTAELEGKLEAKVRAVITERILQEAGLETRVAEALGKIERPSGDNLAKGAGEMFQQSPEREWRAHVEAVVDVIIAELAAAVGERAP